MFEDLFEVFLADTPEGKQVHYNIRYQVYCDEMGYEDKDKFPEKQEFDQWDNHAIHFIVRHKHTGQWVGAVRLIYQNGKLMPLEELCSIDEISSYSYSTDTVELSRLCLVKEIRRRKTEQYCFAYTKMSESDERLKSDKVTDFHSHSSYTQHIIFGLLRAATIYSAENKIKKCYFLSTAALARIIRKNGLQMNRIGNLCNHRGKRFPYMMDLAETLSNSLWKDYKNSYHLYSELNQVEKTSLKVA